MRQEISSTGTGKLPGRVSPNRWQHYLADQARRLDPVRAVEEGEAFPIAGGTVSDVGRRSPARQDPAAPAETGADWCCGGLQGDDVEAGDDLIFTSRSPKAISPFTVPFSTAAPER